MVLKFIIIYKKKKKFFSFYLLNYKTENQWNFNIFATNFYLMIITSDTQNTRIIYINEGKCALRAMVNNSFKKKFYEKRKNKLMF